MRPTKNKMQKSKTIRAKLSANSFNEDEIMTQNKLKKFREIKQERDRSQNSNTITNGNLSRKGTLKEGIYTYDDIMENAINYNLEKSPLIISPDAMLKVAWDLLGMLFIVYQGIFVPFRIFFDVQASGGLALFELIQDFYFITDIFLTANTGFYEKGNLILTRGKILVNYLKFWLWMDLAASFPYALVVNVEDYFNTNGENITENKASTSKAPQILRVLKFMRFMRFLRLIRVLKLKKILVRFEEFLNSESFNLLLQFSKLLFIVLFIAHWGACIWFFIGISEFEEKGISWVSEANLLNSSTYDQYITSIYYYITTMTTVGYGDIVPITSLEKIYSMFSMLIACGVFAYVIGSIGTVLSSRYDQEMIFKQKIMYVDQFLGNKNLNKNMRTKVRRYLEHVLENKREQKIDESEVMQLLNKNLKEEVIMHLNGLLIKNWIFSTINKFDEFCLLLTNVMKVETLNPGDVIFQKGDLSLKLYFVNNGLINIYDQETKIVFKELDNKNFSSFGEIGFFAGMKRCASADSLTFSNLTYILLDLFKDAAYKFKKLHPIKFKEFENELNILRKEVRNKNYIKIKTICYLCDSDLHIAPDCQELNNFNNYFNFKYIDRKHKTEQDIKKIFELQNKKNNFSLDLNSRENLNLTNPSFTKNTEVLFFSFADWENSEEFSFNKTILPKVLSSKKLSEERNSSYVSSRSVSSHEKVSIELDSNSKLLNNKELKYNFDIIEEGDSNCYISSGNSEIISKNKYSVKEENNFNKLRKSLKTIKHFDDFSINNEILTLKENFEKSEKSTKDAKETEN